MQENELKKILQELYAFDAGLKEHEAELLKLISRMKEIRPDTKFDAAFAKRLKAQLGAAGSNTFENKKIFNFNFMNKKLYIAAGSLAVASLLFIALINYQNTLIKNRGTESKIGEIVGKVTDSGIEISKLPAGAFGDLSALGGSAANESTRITAVPMGAGGGGGVQSFTASSDASVSSNAETGATSAVDNVASAKMIAPFFGFKYEYKGDAVVLEDESAEVFRRIKGGSSLSKDVARALGSFGFSELSLSTFSNLQASNFSLREDKDKGLMITFDFNEDNIYISENWEKWQYPERDACGGDQACWDRFRIKISDIPSDTELIAMSGNFLADHKVNTEHYGEPRVDNAWRESYEASEDKANYYIPEYANVIYPLILNGEEVRDQSGSYAGLRVTINLIRKAASGLSGLTPYRYESSAYQLETSSETIVKIAENGGYNRNYYMDSENLKTVELGTPTRAYVQLWHYANNRSEELLVPSLIFPVTNGAELGNFYWQKFVIVPLVKDMLKDLENQPMPLLRDANQTEPASAPLGAGAGGAEPVSGVVRMMTAPASASIEPAPALIKR